MKAKSILLHRTGISILIVLGTLFFSIVVNDPIALGLSTLTESTTEVSHNQLGDSGATRLFIPMIFTPPALILCEGKVYDGYTKNLFVLKTAEDKNPAIQKVIRNCTFRNSAKAAITFNDAQNVLIEGNTFENIRTNIPGTDVHAIDIRCVDPCNINNVIIRNNSFNNIGADGIQLGETQRKIGNIVIQNNTFQGNETSGENAIDVKGVDGPIYILQNNMFGFRPCESPTWQPPGNQDCTGSNGTALVIHEGHHTGAASNIVVEGNRIYDSIYGLTINGGASNIFVRNNDIFDNLYLGLNINGASNVTVEGNRFSNNPRDINVENCTNCTIK
jgi:parallel beta-helix repeat protein